MTTGDPQSFNRYSYCDNDPVNKTDPLGLVGADTTQRYSGNWSGEMGFNEPHFAVTLHCTLNLACFYFTTPSAQFNFGHKAHVKENHDV